MGISPNRGDGMTVEEIDRLRESWRRYWRASDQWRADFEAKREAARLVWLANPSRRFVEPTCEPFPSVPAVFHRLICGARTRFGTPCKRRDLYRSGRCRLHGGLSTGPKTRDGKARSAINAGRLQAERTPCEGQCYGKVWARNEPHARLTNVDLAKPANGWREGDGI